MKKLLMGLGLLALCVACRASGANVHDTSTCTGKDCADCAKAMGDKGTCSEKGDCSGEAAVCPVTGKSTH